MRIIKYQFFSLHIDHRAAVFTPLTDLNGKFFILQLLDGIFTHNCMAVFPLGAFAFINGISKMIIGISQCLCQIFGLIIIAGTRQKMIDLLQADNIAVQLAQYFGNILPPIDVIAGIFRIIAHRFDIIRYNL